MGIADKIPPTLKLGVVGLTVPVFILYVLALVGCVSLSPGIPGIYLFLLKVNEVTLRVGYFAICAVDLAASSSSVSSSQNGSAEDGTICVPTLGFDASELSVKLFGDDGDAVPILNLALTLQRKILVPLVLIAAFLLLFGAIFFALVKVTQMKLQDPSAYESVMKQLGIFKPATLATIWMAVCFAFAAAVASTMAIGALNFIIPVLATNINVTGGRMLQALQYLAFIFAALFALGATLVLPEPLEQQGATGDGFPENEKNLDQDSFDESQMQDGQPPEGEEEQQQQYAEGEYAEGQYQEGQYQEGQYPEGQQYSEEEYAQQQQQYAEGGEYAQAYAAQEQEQQYQQQQYQQQ